MVKTFIDTGTLGLNLSPKWNNCYNSNNRWHFLSVYSGAGTVLNFYLYQVIELSLNPKRGFSIVTILHLRILRCRDVGLFAKVTVWRIKCSTFSKHWLGYQ